MPNSRGILVLVFAQIVLGMFNALIVFLTVAAIIVIIPVIVQQAVEEYKSNRKTVKKPPERKHRYGMRNANDLAQQFLRERRMRETNEYKLGHLAIAGKRA